MSVPFARRTSMRNTIALAVVIYIASFALTVSGQQSAADGPRYQSGTMLVRPANYREWTFLSSGVGMTYAALGNLPVSAPAFGNVFVNPSSYRAFLRTGRWPDQTIFVLETRASSTEGSIV